MCLTLQSIMKEMSMEEKNLVIVESPAKAGTIQKFLGKDYIVKNDEEKNAIKE